MSKSVVDDDGELKIHEGSKDNVVKSTYIMEICPAEKSVDQYFGHNYQVNLFRPIGKLQQIV